MPAYVFDDRERALRTAFVDEFGGDAAAKVVVERLTLGDILLRDEGPEGGAGGAVRAVVERKRVDDLMNSLFDGRLSEQCYRLRAWQAAHSQMDAAATPWIVVIVEGAAGATVFRRAADPMARYRLFLRTYVREALGTGPRSVILRSRDDRPAIPMAVRCPVRETALLLHTLDHLLREGAPADAADPPLPPPPRRVLGDTFTRQLTCTQGVSAARARQVRQSFPNAQALIRALDATPVHTLALLTERLGSGKVARRLVQEWTGEDDRDVAPRRQKQPRAAPPARGLPDQPVGSWTAAAEGKSPYRAGKKKCQPVG